MKKAYNVYSILGKTVIKASMLTSLFALCFLFSSQVTAQTVAQARTSQPDFLVHAGAPTVTALTNNMDRLNPELIKNENALPIAKELYFSHINNSNASTVSDEMEVELRRVFLEGLMGKIKGGNAFGDSFTYGVSRMTSQLMAYDQAQYKGPGLNAIAEGYLVNFF